MDETVMRKKIEIAKNLAEFAGEPYKEETFSIILKDLILGHDSTASTTPSINKKEFILDAQNNSKEKTLKNLDIEGKNLEGKVHFTRDSMVLVKIPKANTRTKEQAKAILIIAYCLKHELNLPLTSDKISEICKNSGINMDHIENAFASLSTKRFLIKEKKGSKLNILTPQGEGEAKKLLLEDD